jgi:hypothetical protein
MEHDFAFKLHLLDRYKVFIVRIIKNVTTPRTWKKLKLVSSNLPPESDVYVNSLSIVFQPSSPLIAATLVPRNHTLFTPNKFQNLRTTIIPGQSLLHFQGISESHHCFPKDYSGSWILQTERIINSQYQPSLSFQSSASRFRLNPRRG